jgi:hypothetical protein
VEDEVSDAAETFPDFSLTAMHDDVIKAQQEARCSNGGSTSTNGPSGTVSLTPNRRAKSGGGRPAKGNYRLADGTKVPSCTTITKRFAPSEGLIFWAWKQGNEGKSLEEARDKAAAIGSNVHDAIEAWCGGRSEDECRQMLVSAAADDADAEKALRSFGGFLRWAKANDLEIIATEVPMVSERHRFGGTVDAIAKIDGRVVVLDWKTGKGAIYAEHIVQIVAYGELWRERTGDVAEEFHVLRPSKATGGFNHFFLPRAAVEPAWRYFLSLRAAYDLDPQVKALLG